MGVARARVSICLVAACALSPHPVVAQAPTIRVQSSLVLVDVISKAAVRFDSGRATVHAITVLQETYHGHAVRYELGLEPGGIFYGFAIQ
jgi:hypothetical protein